jgi:hypothetical protein
MDAATERKEAAMWSAILATYAYVGVWIGLSATVIMYNKFLLAYAGFPYPVVRAEATAIQLSISARSAAPAHARARRSASAARSRRPPFLRPPAQTLTMWHMFFCSALAVGLVKSSRVQAIDMSTETYVRAIVPIGACYAFTLWVGNAAYMYLSVSFIQMLKALMPVAVFAVGCAFGTDRFDWATMANLLVVTAGVAIASAGELNFNLTGVACQLASICAESVRLVLVQILLQSRGLKLNPITTLYYVAPCCFAFLLIPFAALELGKITTDANLVVNPFYMVTNAGAAFALNMAVFLLIGKTSALTMNIAGVVKDWMLIGLSIAVFHSAISRLNLLGYLVAFAGVCWYNWRKLQAAKAAAAAPAKGAAADPERVPLVVELAGGRQADP